MFEIFKVNEGGTWYMGTAATLNGAREQIFAFAEFWPAEYAILDQRTGNWCSFPARREGDQAGFRGRLIA